MRAGLALLPVGLLVLTACASSPEAEVREQVRDVLAAANDEDADATRTAVDELLTTLREQVGSRELTDAQATPVREAAQAVLDSVAGLEEVEPPPVPTQTQTQEPEPTPSEEPSPTPTPSPTPSPTPTPTPEPTEPPVTEAPPPEGPEPEPEEPEPEQPEPEATEPEQGGEGEGEQATVVPALPATPTQGVTPAS